MISEEEAYDLVLRAYPLMEAYMGELDYELENNDLDYDPQAFKDIEKEYGAVRQWCNDAKKLLGK